MESTINFLIRGQAQNGMFLGPDSYNGAVITIQNAATGMLLAQGLMNTGDSGTRASSPSSWSSPYPITTPSPGEPTLYWVTASATTVGYSGSFEISEETTVKIYASVPLGSGHPNAEAWITRTVSPGEDLSADVGVVVPVPGLWVQPEIVQLDDLLRVRAKVTMMCGCEINEKSPWLPIDFVVTATVQPIGADSTGSGSYPMTFQINSQFYANVTVSEMGGYSIRIDAKQISSGLTGSAVATI